MKKILLLIAITNLLFSCSNPIESEQEALKRAKLYITKNYELLGTLEDYKVKIWNETNNTDYPLYGINFIHKSVYNDYANENNEVVDAYSPTPPESFLLDLYTKTGEIDDYSSTSFIDYFWSPFN